ncbi:MAG: hypothetical protein E7266_06755 [Lachnospiraceae bacterium]|nr:hypothetical protein [Lachnospiraceae bacterium]
MAVISGFTLLVALAGICMVGVLVAVIALVCYFLIYNNNINKSIGEENVKRRKMVPPYVVAIILGVVLLVVVIGGTVATAFVGIVSFRFINEKNSEVTYENTWIGPKFDIEFVGPTDIEDELTLQALREGNGYEEVVVTEGDFEFICFFNNYTEDIEDIEEPEFLIYTNYLGERPISYFGYDVTIRELENTVEYSSGNGISSLDLDESMIIAGNIDEPTIIELKVSYIIKNDEISDSVYEETVEVKIP